LINVIKDTGIIQVEIAKTLCHRWRIITIRLLFLFFVIYIFTIRFVKANLILSSCMCGRSFYREKGDLASRIDVLRYLSRERTIAILFVWKVSYVV